MKGKGFLYEMFCKMFSSEVINDLMDRPCKEFEPWLQGLSKEPVAGLADRCWSWIRSWGNGGGDYSTETCIQAAIDEEKTDVPFKLAEIICSSISGYSKTPFEASVLTMDLVNEALCECTECEANRNHGTAQTENV